MRNIFELIDLADRVAIVTGGAGHLGKVICMTLAELGADVAVVDQPGVGAKDFAKLLSSKYQVNALGFDLDLINEAEIYTVPKRIADSLGIPDILVNNAALVGTSNLLGWSGPFAEQTIDTWRKAIELNLTATFAMCQSTLPLMKKQSHGSIINIASIYGVLGPDWSLYKKTSMGNPAAYAASKGGLIQFTRWLASTAAPQTRVNAISPGGIKRKQPKIFQKRYEERTPLQRMANEEDLKGAIAFLASDASAYVTGQNLVVDGGWSIW